MPAPDIETLYRFENAIESAVDTVLTTAGLTAYKQRDTDTVSSPFSTVQFSTGRATGRLKYIGAKFWPDAFEGSLRVGIITERNNAGNHTSWVGKVRKTLYDFQSSITTVELPYHIIVQCLESGTDPSVDAGNNHDLTVISFAIVFQIRSDAWPT